MGSRYITPEDYGALGLCDDTEDDVVQQASAIVDQVLGRPEGLVWKPDYAGAPAYMAALTSYLAFTVEADIPSGHGVVVSITPPIANQDLVGEVLIVGRAAQATTEAVRVTAVSRDGTTLTLDTVALDHPAGALLELGLTIGEERSIPSNRQIARVCKTPVVRLLAIQGRYGYGRRSEQISGRFQDENILAMVQQFGGAAPWITVNPYDCAISPRNGEVFIPGGVLLSSFSDARIRYVAGYPESQIPEPIKIATKVCIDGLLALADVPGSVKVYKTATTSVTRFTASSLDEDTRRMIAPFKALKFY